MTTETPIAFLVFNRPEKTRRVFAEIAAARPRRLLVVADGPRVDRPGEAALCAAVRAIVTDVTWPCEVLRNYSDVNLGCKQRVSSGLDWVFSLCEEAIILEDDCLPDLSFFPYCEELLARYRDDERVMAISGDNFQNGIARGSYSYYFSRIVHVWGWASWRRAWRYYDVRMASWPQLRDEGLIESIFECPEVQRFWRDVLDSTYEGGIDTWDYQWNLACWAQSGLCCLPQVNLVENIGFGSDALHTKNLSSGQQVRRNTMGALAHPVHINWNKEADLYSHKVCFGLGKRRVPVSLRATGKVFVSECMLRIASRLRLRPG